MTERPESNRGRLKLRFENVCKCDIKSLNIRTDEWELLKNDVVKRRSNVDKRLKEMKKNTKKNRNRRRN